MFDGMPEQYHQFITSSRPPPTPPPPSQLPPSFSLLHGGASGGASVSFPPFEPYPNSNNNNNNNNNSLHLHPQLLLHHHPLHHHHHHRRDDDHEKEGRDENNDLDLWTNEEVFELLRVRSSMENWFPDFTWSHVSRKLAELGFKKSAEKCKDKFEEESRHLNNNVAYTKNYRIFSELEEIYHGDQNPQVEVIGEEDDNDNDNNDDEDHKDDQNKVPEVPNDQNIERKENENHEEKKRKRSSIKKEKFEMLKGFCEEIVNKMMSQQEELNNKLIQDLIKRDEQKVAREEAWKKQETERINNEITIRAQEHALTKERQTKIIEFLNKFTSTNSPTNPSNNNSNNNNNNHAPASSSNHNESTTSTHKTISDETGKRWPRDEVLALINLRCNHYRDEKEVSGKGPLWERISKGMSELGYKRNAKRCKEKWENINKYFRKTKDVNKKRSADSRTCPYFHQLTTLYSQGTLGLPEKSPENRPSSPENALDEDDHDDEGEKNVGF